MTELPKLVVLAGPNGAGKTTNSRVLLPALLGDAPFVNADIIETEITEPGEGSRALAAGRIMLERIAELTMRRENLAIETTLASRTFAPLFRELVRSSSHPNSTMAWSASSSPIDGSLCSVRRSAGDGRATTD